MGQHNSTKQLIEAIRGAAQRNVSEAARVVQSEVRRKLSGTRSGRTYPVPGTQQTYTASAPGEPPARRTGDLAKSYQVHEPTGGTPEAYVGSDSPYALPLEKGTRRMAARPHFQPVFREQQDRIKRILSREVEP